MKSGAGGYEGTIYSEQEILNFLFGFKTFGSGGKSLTDNTQGVVLDSGTECKFVDISVFGGIMAVGANTSVRSDSSAQGVILTPGSTPYRVYAQNLNQIYVSGASGTRAS